jgi:hypothetical protein
MGARSTCGCQRSWVWVRGENRGDSLTRHYVNDIETGDFEVDETVMAATDRLFERHPDAQPWGVRIGHRAVYHFGSRSLKKGQ